jgi:toxin ParE1/3/4
MVKVKWTKQAIKDVDNIAEYIAKDSKKYAFLQTHRFFEAVKILSQFPKTGKAVPEVNNENIREILLGNYRIIYRLKNDNTIHILTIHHSKRLLKNNPGSKI